MSIWRILFDREYRRKYIANFFISEIDEDNKDLTERLLKKLEIKAE